MSHSKMSLVMILFLIIANLFLIAEAKTDCNNCGFDGKEIKNVQVVSSKSTAINSYQSSESSHIIIDFESFTDGQDINGINLGGVTLTNPTGVVEIYANN